jgi:hypothetical protein
MREQLRRGQVLRGRSRTLKKIEDCLLGSEKPRDRIRQELQQFRREVIGLIEARINVRAHAQPLWYARSILGSALDAKVHNPNASRRDRGTWTHRWSRIRGQGRALAEIFRCRSELEKRFHAWSIDFESPSTWACIAFSCTTGACEAATLMLALPANPH